ncbi:MAG: phosphotransferase [Coriobacteriia bacterium]|nr:phosphotransferase [Coriobacteriia bacterium]
MSINRNEFTLLLAAKRRPAATQRQLAAESGLSLGTVNGLVKDLQVKGLLEEGRITAKGMAELKPYQVDNAVIMAAGLSSRFAPVSYERPKGLLTVRGEVLIERQIRQLQEAGVPEIMVVVGYKKEQFFYLEEKFGVQIVVNHQFASRNNNSTLMMVREMLGNTYICSSDDYFTTNPFEPYVWQAYYSAEYSEGYTKEWCISTGRRDRIESVTIGGSDAWFMTGHAYFDRQFSQAFAQILVDVYDDPRTEGKLWEEIYLDHVDRLDMEIRRYEPGVIYEFDTLDELREFDPLFLQNLDSDIFDNMVQVLGCSKDEIHDVYPLKKGLTNLSCHFATNDGEYVYRHPGIGTDKMIDRSAEMAALALAKKTGIDNTFIYGDPQKGWKISLFLKGARELDPHDPAQLDRAMKLARKLHDQDLVLDRTFDYFQESKKYEALLREKGQIEVPDYASMAAQAARLDAHVKADDARVCLTHNDFFNLNLLIDQDDVLNLIDWEYAGMSDYASDFGTFVVTCMLEPQEAEHALTCYFDRTPTPQEHRHNMAHVALAGWCWYVWALQKESEGDYVGDWMYTYYRYAKQYLALALAEYED